MASRLPRLALALTVLLAAAAHAHKASDAYLTLDYRGAAKLRVDLALRDLDDDLGLDSNGDGAITWAEVQARLPAVDEKLGQRVRVEGCTFSATSHGITPHSDGNYLVVEGPLACATGPVVLTYSLFFERDPQHRALVRLLLGSTDQTLIATPDARTLTFAAKPEPGASLGQFLVEGVHHILIGADHLLFLTALLLPSVLRRKGRLKLLGLTDWEPRESLKPAALEVLKLVTSFTVAHSVTLALAALDVVELPSRVVESAIALTVVLVAISNLWPLSQGERWGPAFTLGLVHGFGFSSVLKDSGLRGTSLVGELLGFNLGVECGQLMFVAVVVPVCFALSRLRVYPWLARAGSLAIGVIGAVWLYQRAV